MKKTFLSDISIKHPRWIVLVAVVMTVLFAVQFPKVTFDNDPENMLREDEPVRVFHNRVKDLYDLYDFVIVGIVNTQHQDGIFNVGTLGRIDTLTRQLISLHRTGDGKPAVTVFDENGKQDTTVLDLKPRNAWRKILNAAFRQDPHRLFDASGESAIIAPEIISPSVVDNIKQAEQGQLKIEYLMEKPPQTREEALTIRDDALGNPLYKGTLVSEDQKAIALYIPLKAKTYSYNVAQLVEALTGDWPDEDRIFITGQPVAQDTFGVEMLVQMATSAPLAGLAIFLLLLAFFKRMSLIIAPMIVAVVSVICTMGLLIGLGFDVHIMSSMIAIFLMPIAVADSVHILSEFFDTYYMFDDKKKTIRYVIGHLFMPMLYTSLTTMAGFGSLGFTPIPPVRVFGLHVAFGVGLAWVLTMTLIPAYILLFVRAKTLHALCKAPDAEACEMRRGWLTVFMEKLGRFSYLRWKLILGLTVLVIGISVVGISRIRVNDNPVKWFTPSHRIRVADRVLNEHFGGTYTAYLTWKPSEALAMTCREKADTFERVIRERFGDVFPDATREFLDILGAHKKMYGQIDTDQQKCFVSLTEAAGRIDRKNLASWNALADAILYLEPEGLTHTQLTNAMARAEDVKPSDRQTLIRRLQSHRALEGMDLQDKALDLCDSFTGRSFRDTLFELEAEMTAPPFKQPDVLAWIERLQDALEAHPVVGKTSSAVDALKKANYELNYTEPETPEDRARNRTFHAIPPTPSACAQVYTQLEGMKKKDSLFHMVTRDYRQANLWIQLKSGDNRDMEAVVQYVQDFTRKNPPPASLEPGWAGLTYLNVVWQDKMVVGMLSSLAGSFIVVLIMMTVLFRSPLFGLLSMIPLSVTIAFIYGLIGWVGKDYDMPVAVLSALTLGLSVDFAIHFLERARELMKETQSWKQTAVAMFKEPAMAISRNAIVISIGFTPLLVAPLVPYRTVGFFLATIMAVSWLATLFILAALVTALQHKLFSHKEITVQPNGGHE